MGFCRCDYLSFIWFFSYLCLSFNKLQSTRQKIKAFILFCSLFFVSLQIVLKIEELIDLYARSPQSAALAKALGNVSIRSVFVEGLTASAAAVLFASVTRRTPQTILFILPDADEAGYFYQDLEQMLEAKPHPLSPSPKREGESYGVEKKGPTVLFFPSSYRRQGSAMRLTRFCARKCWHGFQIPPLWEGARGRLFIS